MCKYDLTFSKKGIMLFVTTPKKKKKPMHFFEFKVGTHGEILNHFINMSKLLKSLKS